MFIYNGKFNWLEYASNETITVVFPAGFALNDPVSAYWQWTVDAQGNKKPSVASSGVVQSVTTTADGKQRIHFSFGYYTFDAEVTPDHNTLFLTMRNPSGAVAGPIDLAAMHVNPAAVSSVTVYTGRLEWYSYAKGEATALVVPYGVVDGAFFGLYHQWTVDSGGVENANHPVNGMFQDVKYGADGTITAKFSASYYTYNFTFRGKEGSWVLSNPRGGISEGNKLAVAYEL